MLEGSRASCVSVGCGVSRIANMANNAIILPSRRQARYMVHREPYATAYFIAHLLVDMSEIAACVLLLPPLCVLLLLLSLTHLVVQSPSLVPSSDLDVAAACFSALPDSASCTAVAAAGLRPIFSFMFFSCLR